MAGVRTSVMLDEELYTRLMHAAVDSRCSISVLVERALRRTRLMHAAVDSRCSISVLVERALRRGLDEGWLPGERCARRRRNAEKAGAEP